MIHGKPFKGKCNKFRKYGNKLLDPKWPENNENNEKQEEKNIKGNHLIENILNTAEKSIEF